MATRYAKPSGRPAHSSLVQELAHGFREFVRAPLAVGSAFPASHRLIETLLAPVDWSRIRTVIELGPGTGRFTRTLLGRLPHDAQLVAIDSSKGFIHSLVDKIADDRLVPAHGDAQDLEAIARRVGLDRANAVISGIPFSTLPHADGRKIIHAVRTMLAPDGHLLAYQMRRALEPLMAENFSCIHSAMEWRNLPPCHLYWASSPKA